MPSPKIIIKLPAIQADIETVACIDVFHQWIQDNALPWLLLDVADYSHVVKGPGVMLVGHQADIAYDLAGGEAGLLYRAKHDPQPDLTAAVTVGLDRAQRAARLLEAAFPGSLRFAVDGARVILNDRLAYPNDAAGHAAVAPVLGGAMQGALGRSVKIHRVANDARDRLTLAVATD